MPPTRSPKPTRLRSQIYVFKRGAWHLLGERDYLYPDSAREFCHAWPALLQKRLQSSTPHPLPQDAHTNFSYGSEV